MKFSAFTDGREHDIDITRVAEHQYEIVIDGMPHAVDARPCGRDRVSVILDDRSYDISYVIDRERIQLQFWNQKFSIEVLDERKLRMRKVRSQLDL